MYNCSRGVDIVDYIYNITNLVIRGNDPGRLFASSFCKEIKGGARASLEESLKGVQEELSPPDVCLYYYIQEHILRTVVASLEISRSEVEIRMPYVDENFIRSF